YGNLSDALIRGHGVRLYSLGPGHRPNQIPPVSAPPQPDLPPRTLTGAFMAFKILRSQSAAQSSPSNDLAVVFDGSAWQVVLSAFAADLEVSNDPRDIIHTRRFPLTDEGAIAEPEAVIEWLLELGATLPPSQLLTTP